LAQEPDPWIRHPLDRSSGAVVGPIVYDDHLVDFVEHQR